MKNFCKQNLIQLKNLLCHLDELSYSQKSNMLGGASIGQHIRHILEFYQCLINGLAAGVVNYDKRQRNMLLETSPFEAIDAIYKIGEQLEHLNEEQKLILEANFGFEGTKSYNIYSSFERELAYCLEHSVHHQALIKVSLLEQHLDHLITPDFGVAAATIRYQKSTENA